MLIFLQEVKPGSVAEEETAPPAKKLRREPAEAEAWGPQLRRTSPEPVPEPAPVPAAAPVAAPPAAAPKTEPSTSAAPLGVPSTELKTEPEPVKSESVEAKPAESKPEPDVPAPPRGKVGCWVEVDEVPRSHGGGRGGGPGAGGGVGGSVGGGEALDQKPVVKSEGG